MISLRVSILFFVMGIISGAFAFFHGSLFGYDKDVTQEVLASERIEFSRPVLSGSVCRLNLNGWGEGPIDFAATEYLKLVDRKVTLRTLSGESFLEPKEERHGILDYEVRESGILTVAIEKYETAVRGSKIFNVEFLCKSTVQVAVFVTTVLLTILGFLLGFVVLVWTKLKMKSNDRSSSK